MSDRSEPVVLVVEDEPDVAETYEIWLGDTYDVRLAADGPEALEMVDDEVDVVLLDRMMPGMSGDEVLAEIRERGIDCRVAMVTAVDPDFDVIEMGFDEYLTKPPRRDQLRETVETLLDREAYAEHVRELEALIAKRSALEDEKSAAELADSASFERLEDRIDDLEDDLEDEDEDLVDDATFLSAVRDLAGDNGEEGSASGFGEVADEADDGFATEGFESDERPGSNGGTDS